MDLRCAVSLPRGIALRWMVILSSTGFTGCGNSASFHSERGEESLPIENKRPRGILRANSALRMTVFRFFPQPVEPVFFGPRMLRLMVRFSSPQEPRPTKTFYGIASSIAPWRTSQGLVGYALGVRVVCATLAVSTCEIDTLV